MKRGTTLVISCLFSQVMTCQKGIKNFFIELKVVELLPLLLKSRKSVSIHLNECYVVIHHVLTFYGSHKKKT